MSFKSSLTTNEPRHEISNTMVCATSKASDQTACIEAFTSRLNILYSMCVKLQTEHYLEFLSLKGAAKARLSPRLSKCHIDGESRVADQMETIRTYVLLSRGWWVLHKYSNMHMGAHFIESKHKFQNPNKTFLHPLFREKSHFWRD